jgi:hypothetical protein
MAEADIWKLQSIKEGFEGRLCPPPTPLVSEGEGAKCIQIFDKMEGQTGIY